MNKEKFWITIQAIVDGAKPNQHIMTGLPAIDESNEQLRFTRAIEILEKATNLYDTANATEKKGMEFLNSFGTDMKTLTTELQKFWASYRVEAQKKQ